MGYKFNENEQSIFNQFANNQIEILMEAHDNICGVLFFEEGFTYNMLIELGFGEDEVERDLRDYHEKQVLNY